jgi:hypothetical protein
VLQGFCYVRHCWESLFLSNTAAQFYAAYLNKVGGLHNILMCGLMRVKAIKSGR